MVTDPAARDERPHVVARPAEPPDADETDTVRLVAPGRDDLVRSNRAHWARRQRLERQLHDGASLRISALALRIGVMRHRFAQASPDLDESIDDLQEQLHAVLQELRDVAGRIYPTLLDEAGLGPALREAADRSEAVVRVIAPDSRFDPAAEGAAYFAVADLLGGLGAAFRDVTVTVTAEDGTLVVAVGGVPVDAAGRMLDEVAGLDGTIDVTGGTGVGIITARIPCA
ncbi:putative two-component system sensor kinase [Pseudonocardia sp. N23]|nr:putative two-component system sensor kinase [Pseudonocardia sp. N23]